MELNHYAIDQQEEKTFLQRSTTSFIKQLQEVMRGRDEYGHEVENPPVRYSNPQTKQQKMGQRSLQAINPQPKIVKKRERRVPCTSLASLIDNGLVRLHQKASYKNRRLNHKLKEGSITREGIICDCCHGVYSISTFENHAGSTNHRPATNIVLDDGRSTPTITDVGAASCHPPKSILPAPPPWSIFPAG
ncbi:hypothetical protein ACLOJK_003476 [Asimina triloba]